MASPLGAAFTRRLDALPGGALEPVEVAVLDSGIDTTHPDLQGRVAAAYLIEMEGGEPVLKERPLSENPDSLGHGTAVASIIAKLAPNARLVDYRVLGGTNVGAGAAVVAALKEALSRGSRVINMSLAVTADFAPKLMALCERAYRAGVTVVAAKRNMPLVDFGFPAEFSSVVSVDLDTFPSSFMLRYRDDHPIEFVGNGEEVVVAATGGGYTTKTGTSFATPAVSGLCALLHGAHPGLRPFEVKAALKHFAE